MDVAGAIRALDFLREDGELLQIALMHFLRVLRNVVDSPPPFRTPATLRFVLISLLVPSVAAFPGSDIFWDAVITAVQKLRLYEILTQWLAAFTGEQLTRVLRSLKDLLTHNFKRGYTEPVQRTIASLECVWFAALRARNVVCEDFYHEPLCGFLDVAREAHLWNDTAGAWSFMRSCPWLFDTDVKARFIRANVKLLIERARRESLLVLRVRRDHLLHDTFEILSQMQGPELLFKMPLRLNFTGEGVIDGGGVKREFFQLIVKKLLKPRRGYFVSQGSYIWFAKTGTDSRSLKAYGFTGLIFGMAIHNGNVLDFPFPICLYKKIKGLKVGLADLRDFDPALAQTFDNILAYDGNVEVDMGLFFEYDDRSLCENGDKMPVTNGNRQEFCDLVAQYLLGKSVQQQFDAFKSGFMRAAGGIVLDLFRPEEMALLVFGRQELDFVALEKATKYEGWDRNAPTIRAFWRIVHRRLNPEEKRGLLYFVSSCPRAPIKGLGAIPFIIARDGEPSHLPTAHTCVYMLVLPDDPNDERLYRKLKVAIAHQEGFAFK
jgi:hypothetical protein